MIELGLRPLLLGMMLATTSVNGGTPVELIWLTPDPIWRLEFVQPDASQSFADWLRTRQARKAAAQAEQEILRRVIAAFRDGDGDTRMGTIIASQAKASVGDELTLVRKSDPRMRREDVAGPLRAPKRSAREPRLKVVIHTELELTRDGTRFQLRVSSGRKEAGAREPSRIARGRYVSPRFADPSGWADPARLVEEVEAAARFAVAVALDEATEASDADRRVYFAGGGEVVSEPAE